MRKYVSMALLGLLTMGLLASCEKPEKEAEKPSDSIEQDYMETAFGLNLEMVYVKGGTFEMGATAEQGEDGCDDEKPVRTIKLEGYHIGKYGVTQAQWRAVMGTTLEEQRDKANPEGSLYGEGDDYPMYYVSWEEAQAFCKKLSEKTGKKYVLPTEAQWEYAARGGSKSQHYKYAGSDDIEEVAWYEENSYALGKEHPDYGTHAVGTKKANELGIYDMSGNLYEFCSDWYASSYDENDTDNPQGPADGAFRVARGGSWADDAENCRVSFRNLDDSDDRGPDLGFRVAVLP